MSLSQAALNLPTAARWHRGRLMTPLYRRAFGGFGPGSVLVAPQILRGVDRIFVGRRNAFFEGAWLACEDDGQGPILVGDDNYFGHRAHLHAGEPLRIGSRCVFADDVLVTTTDHERGWRASTRPTAPTTIGDDVFVGQHAVVLGGVSIGDGATVAAGAVVTSDVAPGETVAGVPARPLRASRDDVVGRRRLL